MLYKDADYDIKFKDNINGAIIVATLLLQFLLTISTCYPHQQQPMHP